MKTIHINSRKAIEIWKKWRKRGENLSERITNFLIQEDEREQASGIFPEGDTEEEEEQENRIRPPLDIYFAVDPKNYKNMTRWRYFFSRAKPEEIADAYDMLEYDLKMLRPRASSYRRQQEEEKLRLYKQEQRLLREKEVAEAAEVLPPPPPGPPAPPPQQLTPVQRAQEERQKLRQKGEYIQVRDHSLYPGVFFPASSTNINVPYNEMTPEEQRVQDEELRERAERDRKLKEQYKLKYLNA